MITYYPGKYTEAKEPMFVAMGGFIFRVINFIIELEAIEIGWIEAHQELIESVRTIERKLDKDNRLI